MPVLRRWNGSAWEDVATATAAPLGTRVLAEVRDNPPEQQVVSATSMWAPIDILRLPTVEFVVPPSGEVNVEYQGYVQTSRSTGEASPSLQFGVMTETPDGLGGFNYDLVQESVLTMAASKDAGIEIGISSACVAVVTGLTPGETVRWVWSMFMLGTSIGSALITWGGLGVTNAGIARMRVLSEPPPFG